MAAERCVGQIWRQGVWRKYPTGEIPTRGCDDAGMGKNQRGVKMRSTYNTAMKMRTFRIKNNVQWMGYLDGKSALRDRRQRGAVTGANTQQNVEVIVTLYSKMGTFTTVNLA